MLGIQYFWGAFPKYNLEAFINNNVLETNLNFALIFILFAAMEELLKHYVIQSIDKRTALINSLEDAIRYSLASALGFAFIENAYYLYNWWPVLAQGELIQMFVFRSIFTAAAHMIFSGIYGYYYGIGKFSPDIATAAKLQGQSSWFSRIIQKIFGLARSQAFQQNMILKGLAIAVLLHTAHNFLLQFNMTLPVLAADVIGFAFLMYLLSKKSSQLELTTDISTKAHSELQKKDEDAVIELAGIWLQEGKFQDVITLSDRLLEKDPDNKVIQILKTKAQDKISDKQNIKELIGSKKAISDKSTLTQQLEKVKKEGTGLAPQEQVKEEKSQDAAKRKDGDIIDKLTGEGSFHINE
ncbi:PrsW family intramembrane metalloprotease [Candidatus Gracilibacteria bacterium]|nr:PrsW family intramembrane metalloprotease [Candidatus Gracilibacteria bacterium]